MMCMLTLAELLYLALWVLAGAIVLIVALNAMK